MPTFDDPEQLLPLCHPSLPARVDEPYAPQESPNLVPRVIVADKLRDLFADRGTQLRPVLPTWQPEALAAEPVRTCGCDPNEGGALQVLYAASLREGVHRLDKLRTRDIRRPLEGVHSDGLRPLMVPRQQN